MRARVLERLGKPGRVGIAVLLIDLVFYVAQVLPAQTELAHVEAQRVQLQSEWRARHALSNPRQDLPALDSLPAVIKTLHSLAAGNGVDVARVDYTVKDGAGTRRLDIALPLRGRYPQIRQYLRTVVALSAGGMLDEISFERGRASDPDVAAQARLSFVFRATS